MKIKTSLRLLCAILMIAVLVMSLPISTFATAVNASLLSKGSYKEISVSDFDELKAALEADDKSIITLENDITKDIRPFVFLDKDTAEEKTMISTRILTRANMIFVFTMNSARMDFSLLTAKEWIFMRILKLRLRAKRY